MKIFPLHNDFKPFYEISKNTIGNRYVITDIHGCFDTFIELLSKINLTKNDQLFLLGDFLDRGKKGKEMFDWLLDMINQEYSIFPLRGNHEDMMLQAHHKTYDEDTLKLPGNRWGRNIIDKKRNILPKYINIVSKLPYYYVLDNFYLVHAGFDFSKNNFLEDYKSMLWIKETNSNSEILKNKKVIHGHTKRSLTEIKESIKNKKAIVGLDNGVYVKNNEKYGNLVCLNLDPYELFIQKNIE